MAEGDGATADWHSQNTLLAVRTRIDGILDLLGALALTEPEENRERLQSLKLASDYCEQAKATSPLLSCFLLQPSSFFLDLNMNKMGALTAESMLRFDLHTSFRTAI